MSSHAQKQDKMKLAIMQKCQHAVDSTIENVQDTIPFLSTHPSSPPTTISTPSLEPPPRPLPKIPEENQLPDNNLLLQTQPLILSFPLDNENTDSSNSDSSDIYYFSKFMTIHTLPSGVIIGSGMPACFPSVSERNITLLIIFNWKHGNNNYFESLKHPLDDKKINILSACLPLFSWANNNNWTDKSFDDFCNLMAKWFLKDKWDKDLQHEIVKTWMKELDVLINWVQDIMTKNLCLKVTCPTKSQSALLALISAILFKSKLGTKVPLTKIFFTNLPPLLRS